VANKFKRINQESQKKAQNDSNLRMIMGLVIVALITLVVFFAYGFGSNKGQNQANQQPSGQADQQKADITQVQQRVDQAEKSAQANPKDYTTLVNLGNAYYDLGSAYYDNGKQNESVDIYAKSIDPYQKALEQKFDIGVQTDLATAAFYGNKPDVADAAFKKAIEKQPDFLIARFNYGVFLNEIKQDKAAAKQQIEYVANQTKDKDAAAKAKDFLKSLQ
jgi:tetratricopeptide (TPR) repeat protein